MSRATVPEHATAAGGDTGDRESEMNLASLADVLAVITPGGIEAQEARGQADMIASQRFPVDIKGATRDDLTALGFVFLGPVLGDDLFQLAVMPAGWEIVATDHSMWSKIINGEGVECGTIFYKAAFYDRSAQATFRLPPATT